MARKAAVTAVYGGRPIKVFKQDLSNYSRLRSSLSATMRAQTLTLKDLRKASAEEQERYIRELNIWKTTPQREKAARAQAGITSGLERLMREAPDNAYFSPEERVKLATANLKLKNMSPAQAKMELQENLNVIDRVHAQGNYNPSSYWYSKTYIDRGEWDPALASDEMLRSVIYNDMLSGNEMADAVDEYLARLGETQDEQTTGYASERGQAMQDLLGMAALLLR